MHAPQTKDASYRRRLPERRFSETKTIFYGGEKYHLTIGHYEDGSIGEVFLTRVKDATAAKLGSQLEAMCRDAAIIISLALQHGTPIEVLQSSLTRDNENHPQTILSVVADELAKYEGGK